MIFSVFEPTMNYTSIAGMVIYGTELALWLGVFACGSAFNLVPWVKERISSKKPPSANRYGTINSNNNNDNNNLPETVSLRSMPSSTSVFRTASAENSDMVERRRRVWVESDPDEIKCSA